MPRAVKESKLDTRAARSKLPVATKPYYRALDHGLHLGYRKNKKSGRWVARFYDGQGGYVTETLGTADDYSEADGVRVLDWRQAQEKARELMRERVMADAGVSYGPYTINKALDEYLDYLSHNGKAVDDAKTRANGLIRPDLGDVECAKLTPKMIRDWMADIASRPPMRRGGRAASMDKNDPEVVRRRRSTANRTLTILKAALNHAWREGKVSSDDAWRRVQPYKETETARVRYLQPEEITRLLNASAPDFRRLVNAALFTGCRYGELCVLRVQDFHPDAGTINVRASKAGKGRHVVLTDAGQEFFAQLTTGRKPSDFLLIKDDGTPWGTSHQARPMREANEAARLDPPASFHTIRHTYASHMVMAGVPLMVVAKNLGHSDTRMVEKHYGHLAPSYVANTIRSLAPDLGQVEETNVVPMERQ